MSLTGIAARMQLLVHIIRNLGLESAKLKDIAHEMKRHFDPPARLEIIDEIFRVRRAEEQLARDEIGE